jgi:nucleoid DNA-binding protein
MLTRKEREILKTASELITRELLAGEEVGIHHFGKFYTTELEVAAGIHKTGAEANPDTPTKFVHVARFRAWEHFKKQLHAMPTSNGESQYATNDPTLSASLDDVVNHAELEAALDQPEIEEEPLPFCSHCGEELNGADLCPSCGLPPEL